jgi:SpoIID/LytB domain protein
MVSTWRAGERAPGAGSGRRALHAGLQLFACLTAATLGVASMCVGGTAGASPARPGLLTTGVAPRTTPFPDGLVHISGHGLGPGVGMGQWGAFGYAAVDHMTYQWILAHFYGGTQVATTNDRHISVGIIENEGAPLKVTSPTTWRFAGVTIPAGYAGKAVLNRTTGLWNVWKSKSCAGGGGWTRIATGVTNPRAVPASLLADAPANDLLTICRADGVQMTVRGVVRGSVNDASGSPVAETVNLLPLDEYVADVVPSESSWGWGRVGGTAGAPQHEPWGFQELEAQAVAARTYTLAYIAGGGWRGYANICDSDYCQTYPGTLNEAPISTLAVHDTAGEYLALGGQPAPTQYSASTGGWTVQSQFPAVADDGDSVCLQNTGYWTCNPQHDWNVTVPVTTVQSTFPTIGTLEGIGVLSRNGLGDWGGRVLTIRIRGSKGTVIESGDTFQYQFNLDSNWFVIVHPTTTTTTTTTTMAPATAAGASWLGIGTGTGPLPTGRAGGSPTRPR